MRAKSVLILSCILLCITSTVVFAGDVSIETRVRDIIGKMPAEDVAAENELSAELIALGSEPVKIVCRMLGEPGSVKIRRQKRR